MPEKLKVLIITERFYPEEFIINDLAAEWAAGDFKVDVLTQAPSYPFGKLFPGYSNRPLARETWKNINITRFFTVTGYRGSLFLKLSNYLSFAFTGTIAALFKAGKYDRIFIYQTGPLTMALPAVIAGKVYGLPGTIWTQDVWPDTVYAYGFKKTPLLSWFLDRLVSFVYGNCSRILVSCEGFREKISAYAPGKEIRHFPNWPTITPGQQPGAGVKLSDKFNFTFAGNIGKVQNLENVMRGFGLASAENDDIQLNIVGDGSHLERLKAIAVSENIRNVVFWGRRKQSEMPVYFNPSDVMVISLLDEPVFNMTVPAKFQAYLAFSKPVFCVMNGEVRRLVERNGTGLAAEPGAIDSIRDGFLKFYALRGGGLAGFSKNSDHLLNSLYNRGKIIAGIAGAVSS